MTGAGEGSGLGRPRVKVTGVELALDAAPDSPFDEAVAVDMKVKGVSISGGRLRGWRRTRTNSRRS
jgi:hypothetical protein